MTLIVILALACLTLALTGVVLEQLLEIARLQRGSSSWSPAAGIRSVADETMRRMLEEALRTMASQRRLQEPRQ